MFWLGDKCGYLTDWLTQQWVKATGRRVRLTDHPWLNGPVGTTRVIGKAFFATYAQAHGLELIATGRRGLLEDFAPLTPDASDAAHVSQAVKDFYEQTSDYELDAWSEWRGIFAPLELR